MNQLALFVAPSAGPVIIANRAWVRLCVPVGGYVRQIRIKEVRDKHVIVVPRNFVDEAWPWMGRRITIASLLADWAPLQRRPR